jgi:hypothetical protein
MRRGNTEGRQKLKEEDQWTDRERRRREIGGNLTRQDLEDDDVIETREARQG